MVFFHLKNGGGAVSFDSQLRLQQKLLNTRSIYTAYIHFRIIPSHIKSKISTGKQFITKHFLVTATFLAVSVSLQQLRF